MRLKREKARARSVLRVTLSISRDFERTDLDVSRLVSRIDLSSFPSFGDSRLIFLAVGKDATRERGVSGRRTDQSFPTSKTHVMTSYPSRSSGSSPSNSVLTLAITLGVTHLKRNGKEGDEQRDGREGKGKHELNAPPVSPGPGRLSVELFDR